jgi:hypothetical protein
VTSPTSWLFFVMVRVVEIVPEISVAPASPGRNASAAAAINSLIKVFFILSLLKVNSHFEFAVGF